MCAFKRAASISCRSLTLACMPVSLTCGFHGASLIVDPSASEEPLLGSTVAAILNEAGDLLGGCVRCETRAVLGVQHRCTRSQFVECKAGQIQLLCRPSHPHCECAEKLIVSSK